MSGKEINIAIAKIFGWIQSECGNWIIRGVVVKAIVPPNYCNDLNAMHIAWYSLSEEDRFTFDKELQKVILRSNEPHWLINATATQRAEAFLKTLRKWKGAK